jgi:uncharacterized membrane protein required for colicin V production
MVSLTFFFFFLIVLFGLIGAFRGWAKEMMVSFSVILAMFILSVLEKYVAVVRDTFAQPGSLGQFWMRFLLLVVLVYFGYQTPKFSKLGGEKVFARQHLQDTLLGAFLGALNGYLVVGSVWFFMHEANYPFHGYIMAPDPTTQLGQAAVQLMTYMPPHWLMNSPVVYFAVAVAFLFVIVVLV